MSFLDSLRKRAAKNPKKIVLPEGDDKRILKAKEFITKHRIADIILLEKGAKIDRLDGMIDRFLDICREHKKEMTKEEAGSLFLEKSVYVAGMMVAMGMADGFVAGASYTTSDIARAALRCISIDRVIGVMSGAFVVEIPNSEYGHKGVFVFSDCGIVPFPTSEQLAGIALSAAKFADKILNVKPKVAMLSYSTKGSAATDNLSAIRRAVELVQKSNPEIDIDGELQVDSALDPEAANIKHSIVGSKVAGKANLLIFPNLDSGNISYKLIQRLARARAVGPLLLGLEKPASDLSRACSAEDVIDAVAIVSLMT